METSEEAENQPPKSKRPGEGALVLRIEADDQTPPRPPAPVGAPGTPAFRQARDEAEALRRRALAPNTLNAYASDLDDFKSWCRSAGRTAVPADYETVAAYLAQLEKYLAPATVRRRLSAIARAQRHAGHPFDPKVPAITDVLKGMHRKRGRKAQGKAPLLTDDMRRIIGILGDSLAERRDRALSLLRFTGAFRRSELVGIDVEHLDFTDGGVRISLPHSKGDREGEGELVGIPEGTNWETCPVRALKDWLEGSLVDSGPVFRKVDRWGGVELARLTDRSVALIVKRACERAGYSKKEIAHIGAHSLRAGFITAADTAGARPSDTMKHVRLKSYSVYRIYVRRNEVLRDNPAKLVGL